MTKEELVNELSGLGIDDLGELKNDSLEKLVALDKKAADLTDEVAALKELNEALNKSLTESEETAAEGRQPTIVKVDGDRYDVSQARGRYKGREINPQVLAKDKKLAAEMAKIKAGFMRKIED